MAIRTHHVHHVARDPQVAANFYIQHFDGELFTPQIEYKGAPYISVKVGEVEIRIRGLRENETGQDTPPSTATKTPSFSATLIICLVLSINLSNVSAV